MSYDPIISLPDSVITSLDLGKVQREFYSMSEFLNTHRADLPDMSPELKHIVIKSGLNPHHAEDRERLSNQLQFVRRTAPVVQLSFAISPAQKDLSPIIQWFRQNGHQNTLLSIGVQPALGGGCVVRTATKTFDFSFQKLLKKSQPNLINKLA